MAYNKTETDAKRLYDLLESISKYFDLPIKFYALGGTALTILGIKKSTLDIDININSDKDYKKTCEIFSSIGFERLSGLRWKTQEGLLFDIFHGSNILGTQLLSDCLEKSKHIKDFGNIRLYTLSPYDIIISKLARGDIRDFEDIKHIMESIQIDLYQLAKRYKETMEISIVANYKQKLLDLIEIKFGDWKKPIDRKLIEMIKKWE